MALAPRIDSIQAGQNLAINGNFDFWQRGTGVVGLSSGQYLPDRWQYGKSGAVVENGAQDGTVVPSFSDSGFPSLYSYKTNVTTAVASLGANDYSAYIYNVEGHDYALIHGKPFRFQFWWRSTVTGTFSVSFSNSANSRFYVTTFSYATANTWQKVFIDVPANVTGTWNFNNTLGMVVYIIKAAGTGRQTSNVNSWTSSGNIAATTQTNGISTIGNSFWISQVMIVPGSFNSDNDLVFKRAGRTISDELMMCQRYFESFTSLFGTGRAISASAANILIPLRVTKRLAPTSIIQSSVATNFINVLAGNKAVTAWTFDLSGIDAVSLNGTGASGLTTGEVCFMYSTGFTGFDAEL